MSLDEVMFHAQRYGNTEERRERKELAKNELQARGTESLRYLVAHSHVENIWFGVYARHLIDKLNADEAAEVLLELLDSPEPKVKKQAIFLLGFHMTPEHAVDILPFLEDEELAGVTMRTLGKWRVNVATTKIIPFLQDEDERRRIMAANALREIGDDRAAAFLVHSLNDPYFTVRHCAARALVELGPKAEDVLLRTLPRATPTAQRHIVTTLGDMRSRKAIKPLRKLLKHEDWGVRGDAARALRRIDPLEAGKWVGKALRKGEEPYVVQAVPSAF
jgi:HEAT repeat protein